MLQSFGELSLEEDFQNLEGCNEVLNTTRPDIVREVHRAYLEAGSDCIETNSFGAFGVPLAEYDMGERAHELSLKSAQLARAAADEFSTPQRPRFVAGSIGPGTRFASLGNVRYEELREQVGLDGLLGDHEDRLDGPCRFAGHGSVHPS